MCRDVYLNEILQEYRMWAEICRTSWGVQIILKEKIASPTASRYVIRLSLNLTRWNFNFCKTGFLVCEYIQVHNYASNISFYVSPCRNYKELNLLFFHFKRCTKGLIDLLHCFLCFPFSNLFVLDKEVLSFFYKMYWSYWEQKFIFGCFVNYPLLEMTFWTL